MVPAQECTFTQIILKLPCNSLGPYFCPAVVDSLAARIDPCKNQMSMLL